MSYRKRKEISIMHTLDTIKELVLPIARKYNLKSVYVFGSHARGDATEKSDIDLMVDVDGSTANAIRFFGLYGDLCEIFGENTDLVTTHIFDEQTNCNKAPNLAENIKKEAVIIYER